MICSEKKFVFIDITRTGTTSIIQFFNDSGLHCIGKHNSIRNIRRSNHTVSKLTDKIIKNYFKFTIVRNPYERMVSLWLWGNQTYYKSLDYKMFIKKIENNGFDRFLYRYMSMYDWIVGYDGKPHVNYIGRFEQLEDNFKTICEKIDVSPGKLQKLNTSEEKSGHSLGNYRAYYDDETERIVRKLYKKDLDFFGYEF